MNGVIDRKLAAPGIPPCYIERPRTLRLLDDAALPVILVCAPLGWGKSVVLSDLARLRSSSGVVGWLKLAPGDDLLFWEYVVSALRAGGLETATANPATRLDIPARLVASLTGPGTPVTLILDDFHEVRDPDVLAQFEAFLEAVPDRLQVCLGSRADPPLPLHRWRLRGLLAEVRAAELSFTVAESGRLMAVHGVSLPVRALAELNALTEGWAAGLRLAALEMSGSPDPEQRLHEFCRHDRRMADYLLDEVVHRLAPDVVEVLTCTALLDEVDAGLTAAMTGREDGATILEALERANTLITRQTRPGEWYRYHPLLRQVLADELAHRQPSRVAALHRRAADWYSRHGPPSHAIRHYLAAGQWVLAVDVLARSWPDVLASSRRDVLAGPVAVPGDLVHNDPDLALAFAADCLHRDDRAGLHSLVRVAGQLVGTSDAMAAPRPDRDAMMAAFRLIDGQLNGDRERVMAAAGPMLESEPESGPGTEPLRPLALIALGESYLQMGRFGSAREPLRAALAIAEERALEHVRLAATSRLAIANAFLGDLTEGDHSARVALTIVGRHGGKGDEDEERARIALAQIALERFHLSDATYHLDQIFRTRPPTSRILWVLAWTVRLRIRAAGGDPDGAHAELVTLRRDMAAADLDDAAVAVALDFAGAEFELARGLRPSARRKLALLEQLDTPCGWTAVLQARLQMAERQPARALGATAPYVEVLDPHLPRGIAVELCLIHAWAVLLLGNQTKCGRSLETALRLADEDGFRLAFRSAGAPLADLLRAHIRAGTSYPALAGQLVAALSEDAPPERADLAEPLSDRELAVLRHVSDVMSNVEIADAMSVSVNTVKTHLKNIYRKLGTDSRRDAVRRAHARGEV